MTAARKVHQIRLSGPAAQYIRLLHDYGHLDADGVNRLLLGLAEVVDPGDESPLGMPEVRRAAAMMLFPEDGNEASAILVEDWAILFG